MLKRERNLRTFGKKAKINFKERTPKFLYQTEVNLSGLSFIFTVIN